MNVPTPMEIIRWIPDEIRKLWRFYKKALVIIPLVFGAVLLIFELVGSYTNSLAARAAVAFILWFVFGLLLSVMYPVASILELLSKRDKVIRSLLFLWFFFALLTANAITNPARDFMRLHFAMFMICAVMSAFTLLSGHNFKSAWTWVPVVFCLSLILVKLAFPDMVNSATKIAEATQRRVAGEWIKSTEKSVRPLAISSLDQIGDIVAYTTDEDGNRHCRLWYAISQSGEISLYDKPGYDSQTGKSVLAVEPKIDIIALFRAQFQKQLDKEKAAAEASKKVEVHSSQNERDDASYPPEPEATIQASSSQPATLVYVRVENEICSNVVQQGDSFRLPLSRSYSVNGEYFLRQRWLVGGTLIRISSYGSLDEPAYIVFRLTQLISRDNNGEIITLKPADTKILGQWEYKGISSSRSRQPLCLTESEISLRANWPDAVQYVNPWQDVDEPGQVAAQH